MRREYLDNYHAHVLFYPVTNHDHSALQVLLDSLATVPAKPLVSTPKRPPIQPAIEFVHETTEDEKFTGRKEVIARLDGWAADPGVRLIAITAIGGLGKTALATRWLRSCKADGLLFWSFYRERIVKELFEALLKFGNEKLNWKSQNEKTALLGLDVP